MCNIRKPAFHTRHIPIEHLKQDHPRSIAVIDNGLCGTLEKDNLIALKDAGIEVVETRLVWCEIEKHQGQIDWSGFESCVDKILAAGLKVGMFPWFHHPPTWYIESEFAHARYRCLEHDCDSTILSIWDPKTIEQYQRLYRLVRDKFGDTIQSVVLCCTGDFGESAVPSGIDYYTFSPPHNHHGLWSGDAQARQSYQNFLKDHYHDDIEALNAWWNTCFQNFSDNLMPSLPFTGNSLNQRMDFQNWYCQSMTQFCESACRVFRESFPTTKGVLPIGFPDEGPYTGQIKSQIVKAASKYNMICRWTGVGITHTFEESNLFSKRISSAAHFYGADFGAESALVLEEDNAANVVYENIANGSCLMHDDPANIYGASSTYRKLWPQMVVDLPQCDDAVYYPLLENLCDDNPHAMSLFSERAAALRWTLDYAIVDHLMIQDGCLRDIARLTFLLTHHLPETTAKTLLGFIEGGGKILIARAENLLVGNSQTAFENYAASSLHDGIIDSDAIQRIDLSPHGNSENQALNKAFVVQHKCGVSRFNPGHRNFEYVPH